MGVQGNKVKCDVWEETGWQQHTELLLVVFTIPFSHDGHILWAVEEHAEDITWYNLEHVISFKDKTYGSNKYVWKLGENVLHEEMIAIMV